MKDVLHLVPTFLGFILFRDNPTAFVFKCFFVRAERTNTCPMCKERFTAIRHKCSENIGGGVGLRPMRAGEVVEVSTRASPIGGLNQFDHPRAM